MNTSLLPSPRKGARKARPWSTLGCCLLSFATQACGPHRVPLSAPPSDAPLDERVKAFERLEAIGEEYHQLGGSVRPGRDPNASPTALVLSDGTRIHDPRDLSPVVRTDSQTARAIDRYDTVYKRWRPLVIVGSVMVPVGVMAASVGAATWDWDEVKFGKPLAVTGLALFAVGLTTSIIAWTQGYKLRQARKSAMQTYDRDLLIRLDLERVPGAVELVPIETATPAQTTEIASGPSRLLRSPRSAPEPRCNAPIRVSKVPTLHGMR